MTVVTTLPQRDEISAPELLKRCRDAARSAMRSDQWTAEDREDCASELFTRTLEALAMPGSPIDSRTGRKRGILPTRTAPAYCFTAMRHRAANWRDAEDARRDRDALIGGTIEAVEYIEPSEDYAPLDRWTGETVSADGYLAAMTDEPITRAMSATVSLCQHLGTNAGTLPGAPTNIGCVVYQWVRDAPPEECASELGANWSAWRKRTSRGTAELRELFPDVSDLVGRIAGSGVRCGDGAKSLDCEPRRLTFNRTGKRTALGPAHVVPPIEVGQLMFSTVDASREVGPTDGLRGTMAPDERTGTRTGTDETGLVDLTGTWPDRPQTVADARAVCAVSSLARRLTKREADANRTRAQREATRRANMRAGIESPQHPDRMTPDEMASRSRARLSVAVASHRPDKRDVGQTSGTAPQRYASREVRLGASAGRG